MKSRAHELQWRPGPKSWLGKSNPFKRVIPQGVGKGVCVCFYLRAVQYGEESNIYLSLVYLGSREYWLLDHSCRASKRRASYPYRSVEVVHKQLHCRLWRVDATDRTGVDLSWFFPKRRHFSQFSHLGRVGRCDKTWLKASEAPNEGKRTLGTMEMKRPF